MTIKERIEASKPYLTGIIIGLIAAPIIGFGAGWVSTTTAREAAVEAARVDTLASVCSANAERMAAAQSTDLASLKGYENRAKREELVAAAMGDMQTPEPLVRQVTNSCIRTLA